MMLEPERPVFKRGDGQSWCRIGCKPVLSPPSPDDHPVSQQLTASSSSPQTRASDSESTCRRSQVTVTCPLRPSTTSTTAVPHSMSTSRSWSSSSAVSRSTSCSSGGSGVSSNPRHSKDRFTRLRPRAASQTYTRLCLSLQRQTCSTSSPRLPVGVSACRLTWTQPSSH